MSTYSVYLDPPQTLGAQDERSESVLRMMSSGLRAAFGGQALRARTPFQILVDRTAQMLWRWMVPFWYLNTLLNSRRYLSDQGLTKTIEYKTRDRGESSKTK